MKREKKKSVLVISASYPPDPGGVATHVANLAHGLLNRGDYHLCVLTSTNATGPSTYRNGRLMVRKVPLTQVDNFSGRRAPLDDLLAELLSWVPYIEPHIVHAHDFDSVHLGCMLKAAFGMPLVATIHRAPVAWRSQKYAEEAKECYLEAMRIYKFADRLIIPSQSSKDVLLQQGFRESALTVIPHGIRIRYLSSFCDLPDIVRKLPLTPKTVFVLCPVRADTHKDPTTFVRAASLIKAALPKRQLLFLMTCKQGEPEYGGLESLAQQGGLEVGKDIIFESFQRNEMPTLYRRAAVCVIPSRRESFGQTILESFVFRTPVVAANTSALKEIVVNQSNGLLFTDGDSVDLAKQVTRILASESLAEKVKLGGWKSVAQKYTAEKMVDYYANLYNEVISARQGKRK